MKSRITIIIALASWALLADWTNAAPAVLLIDDFDDDIQNCLGGYRNTFQRAPSAAHAERVASVFHGAAGRSVRLAGHRAETGFCGYWIHLFDLRAETKHFVDARPFGFLSFWIRGERGGESLLVKLADKRWIDKEDSIAIGPVGEFLPTGISTEWQEVLIPLNLTSQLDWTQLGGVTFEFDQPGDCVVFIDDLSLKPERASSLPIAAARSIGPSELTSNNHMDLPRKLWVWNTHHILRSTAAADALLTFCQQQRIDELWLQLLYSLEMEMPEAGRPSAIRLLELRQPADMRQFLRAAHERGIAVHALDGFPEFALREFHRSPLRVVDALIAFNAASPAAERFDGVHFDNEPYLLLGWQDPARRKEILYEFLELNAECQRRLREHSTMKFGVDIPFWWQERDDTTGRPAGEVEFNGKLQAASFHCLDLLDNVGVMNYRDAADGADGMIAHGRELLAYADRAGKAKVYMGIETFRYEPTRIWFCLGLPKAEFLAALSGPARELSRLSRLNDFRFRTLEVDGLVHVGVELPIAATDKDQQRAIATLVEVAQKFRLPDSDRRHGTTAALAGAEKHVNSDAEWKNFRRFDIADAKSNRNLVGFTADSIMLGKITFADDPRAQMIKEVSAADAFFRRFRSYGGIAIHYFETFRDKTLEK